MKVLMILILTLVPILCQVTLRDRLCSVGLCWDTFVESLVVRPGYLDSENAVRNNFDRDEILKQVQVSLVSSDHQCIQTEQSEQPGDLYLICGAIYSNDVLTEAVQMFNGRKLIYTNCQSSIINPTNTLLENNTCYCYGLNFGFNDTQADLAISSYDLGCKNRTLILTDKSLQGQVNVEAVVLEHTPIASVAEHAFDEMTSLRFVSFVNNIFGTLDLPQGLFCKNPDLSTLHLEGETFEQFPSQLFQCQVRSCLSQLSTVVIQHTLINVLPKSSFGCARNITTLFLSHNKLNDISGLRYLNLQQLTFLNLSHNVLPTLEPSTFHALLRLSTLDLDNNHFTHIHSSWFASLSNLTNLFLKNNMISSLDGGFYNSPLLLLSLHNNSLGILNVNILNGSRALIWLDMSNNNLFDLEEGSLKNLVNIQQLNLTANKLSTLQALSIAFLEPVHSLLVLSLEHNRITELNDKSFSFFPQLIVLYLSHNLIHYVHPNAFFSTPNLSILYLGGNEISDLGHDMFINLPKLSTLFLSQNNITMLDQGVFNGLQSLKFLFLPDNHITSIKSNIFLDLPQLILLFLYNNSITEIENNAFPASLLVLMLDQNQLSSPPCLEFENQMKILTLFFNDISELKHTSFCNSKNLRALGLSENKIEHIEPGSFRKTPLLQNLLLTNNRLNLNFSVNYFDGITGGNLFLSSNDIHSLENLYMHVPLSSVTTLNLNSNPIREIPKLHQSLPIPIRSEVLDLSDCNITVLDKDAFDQMPMVKLINLTGNQIKFFPNLRFRSSLTSILMELYQNPLECSCQMKWIKENDLSAVYHFKDCINPVNQSTSVFSEFPYDNFVCPTYISCDIDVCDCFIQELQNTPDIVNCSERQSKSFPKVLPSSAKLIYLHGNNYNKIELSKHYSQSIFQTKTLTLYDCNAYMITPTSFSNFRYLEELYLHKNKFEVLPTELFAPLRSLKVLTLHNNNLMSLDGNFLSSNSLVSDLELHNNSLSILSEDMHVVLSDLAYLQSLSLYNNPWQCKCDNMSWKSWLLEMTDKLLNPSNILCEDGSPVLSTPDETFLCLNETEYPRDIQAFALTAGLAVALPLTVIVVMSVSFYYRHIIAVFVYSTFGIHLRKRQDADGCIYDIMLVYGNELTDIVSEVHDWVISLNPPVEVMIPERDIEWGAEWITEVCNAISVTKKYVIFFSTDSVQHNDMMFIFDKCYSMTVDRRMLDIIFILDSKDTMSFIKGMEVSDTRLKAFLHTNNVLIYREKHFYKKLLYLLPGSCSNVDDRTDETLV